MRAIANKYDVTNLSTTEHIAMARELRDNNLISSEMHMLMVAPRSVNEDVNEKTDYLALVRGSVNLGGNAELLKLQRENLAVLEEIYQFSNRQSQI